MNMKVDLCGVTLNNPVMTASGTFGAGEEYSEFVDLNRLGAVVTKGVANVPWEGNPTPRVAEVYGGMLNAIGLQNPGIDLFIERDIPFLKKYDTRIVVNVCGHTTSEYIEVVDRLADQPVDLLEINISCPNVKEGGIAFGQNPKMVEDITRDQGACKTACHHETFTECNRHHGDGACGRSRRCGRFIVDQHADRNEDRYPQTHVCTGKQNGRHVRSCRASGCSAHGISDRTGGKYPDRWYGRDHECR